MTNGTDPVAVPDSDPQFPPAIQAIVDQLLGMHPELDKAVLALAELATVQADPTTTSTLLVALGGGAGATDLIDLVGHVVSHLGDPASNSGLRELSAARGRDIRSHTREWASYAGDYMPHELLLEAAWDADPTTA